MTVLRLTQVVVVNSISMQRCFSATWHSRNVECSTAQVSPASSISNWSSPRRVRQTIRHSVRRVSRYSLRCENNSV